MRYFFHISYHGFHYRGWQRQPKSISIQEILEQQLALFIKTKTTVVGCGRTDAQVNASQYFFHIDTQKTLKDDFADILNKKLPPHISVHDVIPVDDNQHAQLSATERTYYYFFHTVKDSFISELSSYYPLKNLDFEKMQNALNILLNYSDFSGLCKTPDQHSTTQCTIKKAQIITNSAQTHVRIEITSNRFLRGMIRIIVGKLLKIGTGLLTVQEFEHYIASKTTPKHLDMAYPQGLYLAKVTYPFLNIPAKETLHW